MDKGQVRPVVGNAVSPCLVGVRVVGLSVGLDVGLDEGVLVGYLVGSFVGTRVGRIVGCVGAVVGVTVGLIVGRTARQRVVDSAGVWLASRALWSTRSSG